MIFRARSLLRSGFAGGGTDVEPFLSIYGGAILNATISKYAFATIIPRDDGNIIFSLIDKNEWSQHQRDYRSPF
jgi:D-glycero-alpha-D-manno-heptose-7-phosphate kinase